MSWFLDTFLPSFGKCQGKRISEKQFNVFRKYLDKRDFSPSQRDEKYCIIYEYVILGKRIKLQESFVGYGKGWKEYYLTIK